MSEITSYRDLLAWQKAMDLVDFVYRITDKFPESERFGLVLQMRRAVVSIPSNIAEGSRHPKAGSIRKGTAPSATRHHGSTCRTTPTKAVRTAHFTPGGRTLWKAEKFPGFLDADGICWRRPCRA